jgi:glycosyltransferase involved in cell wall biosynthesis
MPHKEIAIIIPAYNEEKRIGKTLQAYSSFFNSLPPQKKLEYEILVVINNTTDKTDEIVKALQKTNPKINYLNLPQGGKGRAVIEGFKHALQRDFNLIGFVDADLATPPEEYYKLIKNVKHHDAIIADRTLKSSKVHPPATFRRVVVSRIFNSLIRALLLIPQKDTQCGAKLFKPQALKKIIPHLGMSQWAFDVDLIYHLKKEGFSILSHPTIWTDKKYSKINFWKAGPKMALAIIRLRILNSPLRRFIRIYDTLLTIKK